MVEGPRNDLVLAPGTGPEGASGTHPTTGRGGGPADTGRLGHRARARCSDVTLRDEHSTRHRAWSPRTGIVRPPHLEGAEHPAMLHLHVDYAHGFF